MGQAALSGWVYSPVPAVEEAVSRIRDRYPAVYPDGLLRFRTFLEKLGNPQERVPFTFHAAGTNGKGSTLAFIQSIFETAGLRVHKFVSPHLVRFEERIVIGGQAISPDVLLDLIAECEAAAAGEEISFFEFFTALAFLAFSRTPADGLLLEAGLGGMFDATNVVMGARVVPMITRISYDHTHVLGSSIAEIAENKAGIIKPNCPAILGPQVDGDVLAVCRRRATRVSAALYDAGGAWQLQRTDVGFSYQSEDLSFDLPLPALPGAHQIDNAGTAIAALEHSPYVGLLRHEVLEKAMANVRWPGRLQRVDSGALAALLPDGWELWLDGAHNDSGAEVLMQEIATWPMPVHMVTSIKRAKNAGAFYAPLLQLVDSVHTVDTGDVDRVMMPADDLAKAIRAVGGKNVTPVPDVVAAIKSIAAQATTAQGRILVAGSLYLVGDALRRSS